MNPEIIISIYIFISILLKKIFSELYPRVDAECYGKIFENIIQKDPRNTSGYKFWRWLFKVYPDFWGFKNAVPRYRVFQKSILIIYWAISVIIFYKIFPWWIFVVDIVLGIGWAFYWMKYEYRYYVILGQQDILVQFQLDNEDVYWLKRIYFAGKWLFKKHFYVLDFEVSAILGTIGMYLTSVVYLIYYLIN